MTRILLTGSQGQVGNALVNSLAPLGEVMAVSRRECDVADADALRALVRRLAPDVVVNAAAYTAVDRAQADRDTAFAVNAQAPAVLAQEAEALGALLIHYSTDYVFDGRKEGAYLETDTPAPLSVYGQSKLEGEYRIREHASRHIILRTSWVFGLHGQSFLKTILRLAADKTSLKVVADQVGAPTSAQLIADVSAAIIARHVSETTTGQHGLYGLYHLASAGQTSWHGYACHVVNCALAAGVALQLKPRAIMPIPATEYPLPAARPTNSRLDCAKLRSAFGVELPHWSGEVERAVRQLTALQGINAV